MGLAEPGGVSIQLLEGKEAAILKLKTVSDVMLTRRDLLRYGGMGLAGATVGAMWPLRVRAAENGGKVTPRNNARNAVFYEISGAISHLDTFDFKDNPASLYRHVKSFLEYYHQSRTHLSLAKDTPETRPVHAPEVGAIGSSAVA